jgi:hypothetical protein
MKSLSRESPSGGKYGEQTPPKHLSFKNRLLTSGLRALTPLILLFPSACADALRYHMPVSATSLTSREETESRSVFTGTWEKGSCSLDIRNGKLTYQGGTSGRSIVLDLLGRDIGQVVSVYFSAVQTIIVTQDNILVSLGGNDILAGRQMIGAGLQFTMTSMLNTRFFSLDSTTPSITDQGIIGTILSGNTLYILTRAGQLWWFDTTGALHCPNWRMSSSPEIERLVNPQAITNYDGITVLVSSNGVQTVQHQEDGTLLITTHRIPEVSDVLEIRFEEESRGCLLIGIRSPSVNRLFKLTVEITESGYTSFLSEMSTT